MKQVKVKKIKKIPKYNEGTPSAGSSSKGGINLGQMWNDAKDWWETDDNGANVMGAVNAAGDLISTATSGQSPTVGSAISSTVKGMAAGAKFGLVGAGIGAAAGLLAGTKGSTYSYDPGRISTTSNVADSIEGGGWSSWFGRSKDSVMHDAAQYQNSLAATELTSHMRAKWANDPRNQSMTFNAKDGGIVPDVVHAKLSKGELYYDPYTKTLSRVPGSPDKPNTDDDEDAFLARGGMIVTNSDEQPLINGKTQAIALAPMVDKPNKNVSKGTIEARDRIIKKVTRLNELSKTENNKKDDVVYAYTGNANIGNNENQLLNWLRGKTKGTILGKNLNPPVDGDTRSELEKVRDRMKRVRQGGSYFDDPYQFTFSPQSKFGNRNLWFTTDGIGGFKPTDKFGYLGPQSTRQFLYTPDVSDVVIPSFDYGLKSTSQKTSAKKSTPQTTTPTISRAAQAYMHNPENPPLYVPEASLEPGKITDVIKPIRAKDAYAAIATENSDSDDNTKSTTNWEDLAYKAASILTPLFDREKAEATRLQRPTWHGIPVAVDVLNQLQDAQLGYALANYNTAQGGYTAGQQLAARGAAASNLARQRAATHQWQTEQQNKNIAQNIASLNAHSNVLAEIENKEIDINDANRAAARSVKRQRRAEAMKNWGQVLRDKNQQAMDDMRMVMIEPLLQYAYENPEAIKKIYNKRSK